MKNALNKRIINNLRVPEDFIRNYQRYIILKCLLFGVIMLIMFSISIFLSGFSGRSKSMTVLLVMLISISVSGYGLDIHLLLFNRTWIGKIDDIECKQSSRRTSKWNDIYFTDTMVYLYVTPEGKKSTKEIVLGNCKDSSYSRRLRALGLNESFEGSFEKNPFYEKMPYNVGDTLLFLRGLKYPLRVLVDATDKLQYVVCPYCGDCFKIEADKCPRCKKTLIYGD